MNRRFDRLVFVTFLCFASLRGSALHAAGVEDIKNTKEIRAVENYVPYEEFLKIAGSDPNATVMSLQEYRNLVELATAQNGTRKLAPLPPIESALLEATYSGQAGEFSARFDVRFKLVVAGKEWTRVDLGAITNLGHVTLDGQPGWVILENNRAQLLVKGAGLHEGTLSFALPLQIEDDVQKLSANLLAASSGSLRMTVLGRAIPSSQNGPLDSSYDSVADATSFVSAFTKSAAANGSGQSIALQWKRKYDSRKSDVLLQATHHISYLLNPTSPYFYWQSSVQISRRKTAELAFVEPPGCRTIRLSGVGVHSWVRDGGLIRVVLDEAIVGDVFITASGVLPPPAGEFSLTAPELTDAKKNTRTIALYEPPATTLTMTNTIGLSELSLDDRPNIQRFQWPRWDGRLARQFFVKTVDAKAGVRVTQWTTIFDTRTAAYLTIGEKFVSLRCTISVQLEIGRLFSMNLAVPAQWKLTGIQERGTGRGIAIEPFEEGKEDNWTIRLKDSAGVTTPFDLDMTFVLRDPTWSESSWQTHALNFTLPSIGGARRSDGVLGVAAHASIDVAFGEMPAWHADFSAAKTTLNVADSVLRAGLVSETAGGELRLNVSHSPPRGEYESVLHVQTLEREVAVRADIRVLALERARAVEELVLDLPANAKDPISIAGKEVREIAPGALPNQRIVRFNTPWRAVRMLCVEYRATLAADTDVPVPDIRVEGNFDSRRWIVFQSAGVVSLEVKPGESLQTASLDETPSFANPIKTGRALFAFTFGPGEKYGSFRTHILETAPVLSNLVRDLNLVTIVDESGIARTHADMILSYSQQYVEVKMPSGAKLLVLCVDGENAKPNLGGTPGAIKIPVPPRSSARVEWVYEQDFGALGPVGSLDAIAPEFIDFPVRATTWTVYHPANYAIEIVGGNMTQIMPRFAFSDPTSSNAGVQSGVIVSPHNFSRPREPRFFVAEFLNRIVSGEGWFFTSWRDQPTGIGASFNRDMGRQQVHPQAQSDNGAPPLKSLESASAQPPSKDRAIGGLAIPEGASVKTAKLGGSAHIILSYRGLPFSAFAIRSVFLLAFLAGIALMLRKSFSHALVYVLGGLILGSLIPLALNWESPLLLIPFCEGLTAFACVLGIAYAWRGLARFNKRSMESFAARATCVLFFVFGAAWIPSPDARAGESGTVLIPYSKDGKLPLNTNPVDVKVYVPKSIFIDLMNRVKPEKKDAPLDAPMSRDGKPSIIPYSLGNAEYELSVDSSSYTIKGTLDVTTYDPKGWAKFPLDFGPSRLVAMQIDGQPAGVSNDGGMLFVQLKGAKKFTLEFELRGSLLQEAGRASLQAQVIPGGATHVAAVLPSNVELDPKALPAGAWIVKSPDGKTQRCELTLGAKGSVALSWRSAEIRDKGEARISAQSYMQFELGLDGYAVSRLDRVQGDGSRVDQLTFKVVGDWNISSVAAPGLSEWTTSGDGAERRLRLWFQKPISSVTIQTEGWAALGSTDAPAAGLTLESALRQEGFIGLKHGDGRHFSARSFDGLKRASQEELASAVTLPSNAQPDRILHYNGSPGEARVEAEPEPSQVVLETQFSGVVRESSMTIGARTRFTVSGRGPLRHEVELPPNWVVRTVRATSMREWEIVDANGKKKLVVHFTGRAKTGDEIRWSVEAAITVPATDALHVELPQPRAIADAKTVETIDWILAADGSLTLSQSADTTMQPVPVERAPRWVNLDAGQDWRLAFRSAKSDTKLGIDISRQDSLLYATVVSFVSAAEEHIQIVSRIRYRIEHAGRDRFTIRLPGGSELIGLDATNLRGRDWVPGANGGMLTVLMQSPISGEQIVDIAYRLPRAVGKDAIAEPPSIEDAGTRGVEHYAGLLPSASGATVLVGSRKLTPVKNAEELPFLPVNMSKKALSDVFAAEPGWSMILRETALKMEAGAAAEVVNAEIESKIALDGGVRSEARYRVRNHSLQFLEIAMPPDSKLWGVFIGVGSASVSRRIANGLEILAIPLPRMTETDLPVRITIVYESARAPLPAIYTTFTPIAPRVLDVPVVETHWKIYAPEEYDVSRSGGNMKDVVASLLDGSRVNSNIKEISRLAKIADVPEQRPAIRKRALQSIALEQQELNDNVTALGSAERNAANEATKRISRDELTSQMILNSDNLRLGNEWQLKLGEQKRKRELDAANSENLDPEQVREYLDHFNFLNIHWRPGTIKQKEMDVTLPSLQDMRLEDLRFLLRFPGYRRGELSPPPSAPAPELEKAFVSQNGILEADSGRTAIESHLGGFQSDEKRMADLRMSQLNFRGVEVHPELTLTFRSKSKTQNIAALAALIALGIAGFVIWKMKRRTA